MEWLVGYTAETILWPIIPEMKDAFAMVVSQIRNLFRRLQGLRGFHGDPNVWDSVHIYFA